jgi:predicted dehydrogenase
VKKLRVGIIGMGVGEQHIAGYHNHPACKVVASCDFSEEKRKAARAKYPDISNYENSEAILKNPKIDIVSIASYDNYHYEQIVGALENDKHVFVEKPLCLYSEHARHIRSLLGDKPKLKLSSNLILRKSERFCQLKEMADSGRFGKLYYVEGDYNYGRLHKITEGWRGQLDFYSVVYGGGVHIVDLLLWLTGRKITEVSAYGNNICVRDSQFRYNDTVVSILKFEGGMVGKMGCNFGCVHPHFHNLSIYGTEGTFVNDLDGGKLFLSRERTANFEKIDSSYPGVNKGALIHSFVESILNGAHAEVSTDDVFRAMSVCFAIEEACQRGVPVEVEYI